MRWSGGSCGFLGIYPEAFDNGPIELNGDTKIDLNKLTLNNLNYKK